jgi:Flp pilus assembly protein TadD
MKPWLNKWSVGLSLLLASLGGTLLSHCGQHRSYAGLSAETAYVGSQSCQSCHQDIYTSYLETGMGRSLYPPDTAEIMERFGPEEVVNDPRLDFSYVAFWRKNELFIREFRLDGADTVFQRTEKVDYIVGSGHQTRSYLLDRNGYLYEHPITWYVSKQIWDLSPGYVDNNSRFSREIGQECLSCHTGYIDYVPQSKNRYREVAMGIDCEKCHGPGQVHLERMLAGQQVDTEEEIDYSIVNPANLPLQAQFDVCQQCHLQGVNVYQPGKEVVDFRPGMRLHEVYDVFLESRGDSNAFGIASHAERLQQSRCFIGTAGKLTCTTCHNPHKSITVSTEDDHIRQCLRCHSATDQLLCAAPEAEQQTMDGNCVSCHMPKGGTSDIPHVSFHDHKIRVVEPQDSTSPQAMREYLELHCVSSPAVSRLENGAAWLSFFERQEANPAHLRRADSLLSGTKGYAAARVALYQGRYEQALALVEELLEKESPEPEWRFLKGEILEGQGNVEAAFSTYDQLYQSEPENIEAGLQAVLMLLKARTGQSEVLPIAQQRLEVLRQAKPFDERILANLGFVALNQGELSRAQSYLFQALSYQPDQAAALENMVMLQLLQRNPTQAGQYLERLQTRHPNHPALPRLRAAVGE